MKISRRSVKIAAASSAAAIFAVAGSIWMTKDTPVERADVIAAYERDKQGGVDESATIAPEVFVSTIPSPGPAPRATVKVDAAEPAPVITEGRRPGWPLKIRPPEGVYLYDTEGGERLQGVPVRPFPAVTRRYIYHRGAANEWGDHHLFLEERKSWAEYRFGPQGRLALSSRQYVQFGPQKEDRTIVFDPPALTSPVPWRSGQTWEGTYSGKVHGDYRGRSEAKQMRLDGKTYEIWSDFIHLTMHGEVEGEVDVERWISPETGITFYEHYVAGAKVGAFTYSAEWKVRLRSVTPEHQ